MANQIPRLLGWESPVPRVKFTPRLILPALLVFLPACGSRNTGLLENTVWTSLPATIQNQSFPAGHFRLQFGPDDVLEYRAGNRTYRGVFALGRGDRVIFKFPYELAGLKDHTQRIAIDGDRLTLTDTNGVQVAFARSKR